MRAPGQRPTRGSASHSSQQPGSGPLTVEAKLAGARAAPQPIDTAAPDLKPFAAPGGAVYRVTLPANLEAGDYRLVVEATLGREKASRELTFRVVGG